MRQPWPLRALVPTKFSLFFSLRLHDSVTLAIARHRHRPIHRIARVARSRQLENAGSDLLSFPLPPFPNSHVGLPHTLQSVTHQEQLSVTHFAPGQVGHYFFLGLSAMSSLRQALFQAVAAHDLTPMNVYALRGASPSSYSFHPHSRQPSAIPVPCIFALVSATLIRCGFAESSRWWPVECF